MSDMQEVLDHISESLKRVEEQIASHPYVAAVENGEVSRKSLITFAAEQRRIITSDLRSVAHLLARADSEATTSFFTFVLAGEQIALSNLAHFADGLGLDMTTLESHEPLAEAQAYRNYMAWLALQGPPAGVAAAFLVNFPAWGSCCGRMAQALKSQYGLNEKHVAFFIGFATPSEEFARLAHAVINEGLKTSTTAEEIRRVAMLLQHYELMYWDAMHAAAH